MATTTHKCQSHESIKDEEIGLSTNSPMCGGHHDNDDDH